MESTGILGVIFNGKCHNFIKPDKYLKDNKLTVLDALDVVHFT